MKENESLTQTKEECLIQAFSEINLNDSNSIIKFGSTAQKKVSEFSSKVLERVRVRDAGDFGKTLANLSSNMRDLGTTNYGTKKRGFLAKLLKPAAKVTESLTIQDKNLNRQIETIAEEADKMKETLSEDFSMLDELFGVTANNIKELDVYIQAGNMKLDELREETIPELKKKATDSDNDPLEMQEYHDALSFTERLEKKLDNLRLCRSIAGQMIPQIKMIQAGDLTLIEKLHHMQENTIPVWKTQVVLDITILRSGKIAKLNKQISDTTNELLTHNAKMLRENIRTTAEESERGVIDTDSLRVMNEEFLSTIKELATIRKAGKERRKETAMELEKIDLMLRDGLTDMQKALPEHV